jgi:hypothetical protein
MSPHDPDSCPRARDTRPHGPANLRVFSSARCVLKQRGMETTTPRIFTALAYDVPGVAIAVIQDGRISYRAG